MTAPELLPPSTDYPYEHVSDPDRQIVVANSGALAVSSVVELVPTEEEQLYDADNPNTDGQTEDTRSMDIEAAHAEALAENEVFDAHVAALVEDELWNIARQEEQAKTEADEESDDEEDEADDEAADKENTVVPEGMNDVSYQRSDYDDHNGQSDRQLAERLLRESGQVGGVSLGEQVRRDPVTGKLMVIGNNGSDVRLIEQLPGVGGTRVTMYHMDTDNGTLQITAAGKTVTAAVGEVGPVNGRAVGAKVISLPKAITNYFGIAEATELTDQAA